MAEEMLVCLDMIMSTGDQDPRVTSTPQFQEAPQKVSMEGSLRGASFVACSESLPPDCFLYETRAHCEISCTGSTGLWDLGGGTEVTLHLSFEV